MTSVADCEATIEATNGEAVGNSTGRQRFPGNLLSCSPIPRIGRQLSNHSATPGNQRPPGAQLPRAALQLPATIRQPREAGQPIYSGPNVAAARGRAPRSRASTWRRCPCARSSGPRGHPATGPTRAIRQRQLRPAPWSCAESDAKRTVNTTQAGQQYDEAGQLVMTAR